MPISDTIASAINEQITREIASAYTYMAMSAWFETQDLPGFASWMRSKSREELDHANRFYDHLMDRGGSVTFGALDAPRASYGSVREAIEAVATQEAEVTASIDAIYKAAVEWPDYAAQTMLNWFIEEQVEEEKSVADILGRLRLIESGGGSLLMLDKELAKRGQGEAEAGA